MAIPSGIVRFHSSSFGNRPMLKFKCRIVQMIEQLRLFKLPCAFLANRARIRQRWLGSSCRSFSFLVKPDAVGVDVLEQANSRTGPDAEMMSEMNIETVDSLCELDCLFQGMFVGR